MRIVQLSDLHLSSQPLYGVVDTLAALQLALRRVVASPAPDLLLLTGDLTSAGGGEEYALLRSLLAVLPFPCALLPGNHDDRDRLRAVFPGQAWAAAPLCCQRLDFDGGTLLLLDSIVPGEEWGEVAAPQIDWLEAACPQRRPVLLALHHPPFNVGIAGMDRIRCRGEALLAAWLARHEQVEAMLCGHVHRFVSTTFAGRPAIVAPSPAHQIALQDGPLAYTLEPGGYLLHDWSPGERLCSHYLPVATSLTQCYGDG
ncbi:MAG TPA: phosphodiesterase [Candidatus Accumulibacter phosphatis]|nr:MAG: 3',5'-cyclic adenosine monophosphate phosphodiesterase CpdA [Candidatus Accumulibacter sp. SK-11]HAY27517.1 phosphodiesterase [Accumulibacter sp.]HCN67164.1 phosphodiesterase [Accumulibacter sp.]HRL75935.1 phosphodiesterase [Candidatus Accumulibacter phosphatis]HRQ95881.1 phosphodiesterase [Candidatus Accumulibacter phosphatis]